MPDVIATRKRPDVITTGKELKRRREEHGRSQAELGEDLEYHEKTIARLEAQKRIPKAVGLAAAAVLARSRRR